MTRIISPPASATRADRRPRAIRRRCGLIGLAAGLVLSMAATPASAQVESFILQPGSNVGPASKVKATNCVTAPDGSVTCDTKIENNPADTPARPEYSPFKN